MFFYLIKGAVIASDATPDKNKLSTDTLTYSDIQNKAEYSASSTGIGYSSDKGFSPSPGMPVSGDASSTTKSAIEAGIIEVRSNPDQDLSNLSRDTENASQALAKIFDKKTVEERQELAKVFGEVAYKLVGDIAQRYQKEKFKSDIEAAKLESEAKKAEENGKVEKANELREKAAQQKANAEKLSIWDEGGKAKIALHALVGSVMSTMGSGSFASGALAAGINESLQNEITKLPTELRSLGSAVIGTVVSETVDGDGQSGATITTSAAENNTNAHVWIANEIKNILTGTLIDYGASWITGEDFDLMQSILNNSSYNDLVQVFAKLESGDYIGAMEHTVALGSSVGFGKNVEKLNQLSEKVRKYKRLSKGISEDTLKWLNKGDADNIVYSGIKDGEAVYTGITKQELAKRLYQHNYGSNGKSLDYLEGQVSNLTRNQARAIEQYLIENSPANELNQINSISPNSQYYKDALQWAENYLNGLK